MRTPGPRIGQRLELCGYDGLVADVLTVWIRDVPSNHAGAMQLLHQAGMAPSDFVFVALGARCLGVEPCDLVASMRKRAQTQANRRSQERERRVRHAP